MISDFGGLEIASLCFVGSTALATQKQLSRTIGVTHQFGEKSWRIEVGLNILCDHIFNKLLSYPFRIKNKD